jgi:hypothetical protein
MDLASIVAAIGLIDTREELWMLNNHISKREKDLSALKIKANVLKIFEPWSWVHPHFHFNSNKGVLMFFDVTRDGELLRFTRMYNAFDETSYVYCSGEDIHVHTNEAGDIVCDLPWVTPDMAAGLAKLLTATRTMLCSCDYE